MPANELNKVGTVELHEINEEDRDDYTTGYWAGYSFAGIEDARITVADSASEALRQMADRIEHMYENVSDPQRVTITNNMLPVGLMEDYTQEETAPDRGEDD